MPPAAKHQEDVETNRIERKQNWFDSQLLKIGVACFTFTVPLAISFFVWIATIDKRLTIVEEKQSVIVEMRDDIKKMREELVSIKIQLAKLNKGNTE
jgi:hypothetical protein